MKKIKTFNEYYRILEKDDEDIDSILGDDNEEQLDNTDNADIDNQESDAEDSKITSRFSPEDLINKELQKIQNIISNIFTEDNEIGNLQNSTISNNYTNYTIKLKYTDGEYEYSCYIEIPLEEVVDNKEIKTIYFKMKKYLDSNLIGERDEEFKNSSEFTKDFLIKVNIDLDSDFNLNKESDDLGLEFEEE
jgi:hypothetical protein